MTDKTPEDRVVEAIMAYWRRQHGGFYDHHGIHILDHTWHIREIVRDALQERPTRRP